MLTELHLNKKRGRDGVDRIYLFLLNLHLIEIFM
nr:MAG TPA: hypothetical protein [Caudoviricetes sp.]